MSHLSMSRARRTVLRAGTVAIGTAAVGIGLLAGPAAAAEHDWTGVAQCESSGNWHINTGNGYYGGLQFSSRRPPGLLRRPPRRRHRPRRRRAARTPCAPVTRWGRSPLRTAPPGRRCTR
jgi:hypothetical protein